MNDACCDTHKKTNCTGMDDDSMADRVIGSKSKLAPLLTYLCFHGYALNVCNACVYVCVCSCVPKYLKIIR